ncbi:PIN domain-containing protein [Streptomyces sp. NPDC002814]
MSDYIETVVLDHTCLVALHDGDEFFTGLYIEASHQRGRILVPSLCILAADRLRPGCGTYAASLRFTEEVPFTAGHAVEAMSWPRVEPGVAHAAAVAWQMAAAGEPVTVLSLRPEEYPFTSIQVLNPYE